MLGSQGLRGSGHKAGEISKRPRHHSLLRWGNASSLEMVWINLWPRYEPLCCWWLIWSKQNDAKNLKNDWNPSTWVLTWKYSARARYPMNTSMTWFRCFQEYLHPCPLEESSLNIGRVKSISGLGINLDKTKVIEIGALRDRSLDWYGRESRE